MSELQRGLAPDSTTMRTVMGHFGTGVTVVTAMADGEPIGMACNSFTSLSLDPALVLFCAARSSSTWPKIQSAKHYCANILAENDEPLCRSFASKPASERYDGVGYAKAVTGAPVLDAALAYVDCEIVDEFDGGDHVIVVGRVVELGYREGAPLLFFRGGYGRYQV